jgi:hypothetical protein
MGYRLTLLDLAKIVGLRSEGSYPILGETDTNKGKKNYEK